MNPLKGTKSVILFRKEWRAAIKGTKFLGRNGRSTWTGKTALRKEDR